MPYRIRIRLSIRMLKFVPNKDFIGFGYRIFRIIRYQLAPLDGSGAQLSEQTEIMIIVSVKATDEANDGW